MHDVMSPGRQAAIFSVLVIALAAAVAPLYYVIGDAVVVLHMLTPVLTALFVMFVIAGESTTGAGERLGLNNLALSWWPVAFFGTAAISVVALLIAYLLPSASLALPANWLISIVNLIIVVAVLTFTLIPGEEIGWRGFMLPRLQHLGNVKAMTIVGVVHAAWHMPLILGTSFAPIEGNKLVFVALFFGTVIAASFAYGLLRIYSGSVWPVSLAHAVHNAMWGFTGSFIVTTSPVAREYVAGDVGVVIMVGAALMAAGMAAWHNRNRSDRGEVTASSNTRVMPAQAAR